MPPFHIIVVLQKHQNSCYVVQQLCKAVQLMKLKTSLSLTGLINQELPRLFFHLPYAFTFSHSNAQGFEVQKLFFFTSITSGSIAYISTTSVPFYLWLHLFHALPSSLSHVPLSQASSMAVSCHFVRHICIAVPRGKQRLEEKICL